VTCVSDIFFPKAVLLMRTGNLSVSIASPTMAETNDNEVPVDANKAQRRPSSGLIRFDLTDLTDSEIDFFFLTELTDRRARVTMILQGTSVVLKA
jgi:hypothetical protein